MNAVYIVTIKEKLPLYKKEELTTKVELVKFEEMGFSVVAEKDLHKIGDKAVFILPDFCVSDLPIFKSFIAPNGKAEKSYLGKVDGLPRRIRAKKFNLHIGDELPVYSNGILLSLEEVAQAINIKKEAIIRLQNLNSAFLENALDITKYEQPEIYGTKSNVKTNGHKLSFPLGVYKTDETNINLAWNYLENKYPIMLIASEKIDGSSISIGITEEYPEGFIASRNINKPLIITKIVGRRKKKTFWETICFWKKVDLNIYETMENDDTFVKAGMPYLKLLKENNFNNYILRGELNGSSCKGSGCKNNPSSKENLNIKFFGVDYMLDGRARKINHLSFIEFCDKYNIPTVPFIFKDIVFNSKKEIEDTCNQYFKDRKKKTKEIIEGLVLKTENNTFSAKFMNDEYDSKK